MTPLFFALALAAPVQIPVQGSLTDVTGAPIDGARQVTFRLYDDPAGGEAHRTWFETQTVTFSGGAFSASLGSAQTLDSALLAPDALLLGVTIADGTESALTPVGYAARAAWSVDSARVGGQTLSDLDARYASATDPRLSDSRAPTAGSASYIQNNPPGGAAQAGAGFNVAGSGQVGGGFTAGGAVTAANFSGSGAGLTGVNAAQIGGQTLTQLDSRYRSGTWVPAWTDVSGRPTWVDAGPYTAGAGLTLTGRAFAVGGITPAMFSSAVTAAGPAFYEGELPATTGNGVANADATASGGQRWLIAASQPSGRAFGVHNTELSTTGHARWGIGPSTITVRIKVASAASASTIGNLACSALRGGNWVAAGPAVPVIPSTFAANTWTNIQLNCDFRPDDANTFVGLDGFVTGVTDVSIDWVSALPAANRARSCMDVLQQGRSTGNGVYTIQPFATPIAVYCDMTTRGGGWTLIAASAGGTNMPRWSTATSNPCTSASPSAACFVGRDNLGGIPFSEFAWSNTAAAVHTLAPIAAHTTGVSNTNAICANDPNEYYRMNQDSATQGMGYTGCVPTEFHSSQGWCESTNRVVWNQHLCTDLVLENAGTSRSSPDYNCSPFGAYVAAGNCNGFHNIRHWRR